MKTLPGSLVLAAMVAMAACHPGPPATAASDRAPGGASPEAAVQRFFAAVHADDLPGIGEVWGTTGGAAGQNGTLQRDELQKRELILQCYFNFDSFRIVSDQPAQDGRRAIRVQLTRGGVTRVPTIYTVQGPGGRWFVENLDMSAVRDFCGSAPANPGT